MATIANTEETNSSQGRRPSGGELDEDEEVTARVKARKSIASRLTGNPVSVSRVASSTQALGAAGRQTTSTDRVRHQALFFSFYQANLFSGHRLA